MAKSNIFLFRAHVWNEYIEKSYYEMQQSLGDENVYILFDDTNHTPPDLKDHAIERLVEVKLLERKGRCILCVNHCELLRASWFFYGQWFNSHETVIFYNAAFHFPFDYIWLIEYDVRCDGDWAQTLAKASDISCDFLSSYVEQYESSDRTWYWWDSLFGFVIPDLQYRWKCFFPVNRFSKRLLNVMTENVNVYNGYCEVYVPTLAALAFGAASVQNLPKDMLGEFSCPVVATEQEWETRTPTHSNRLYHKVG